MPPALVQMSVQRLGPCSRSDGVARAEPPCPLHQLCPRQGFHFSEPQLPHPWDGGDVLLVGVKRGCLRVTAAS